MKINNYLPLAIATVAIAAGNTASAGDYSYQTHSANRITVSLIVQTQGESVESEILGVPTNTEVVSQRAITNRSILLMLKDEGEIPDNTISGWSIVAVSGSDQGLMGFYIIKTGQEPVDIDEYMDLDGDDIGIRTGTSTESGNVTTDTYNYSLFNEVTIRNGGYYDEGSTIVSYTANLKYKSVTTETYESDSPPVTTHALSVFNMSAGAGALEELYQYYYYEDYYEEYYDYDYDSLVIGKIVGSTTSLPIEIQNWDW